MYSFICSPGKEECGVECFGWEGLYNHAHAYASNVYVRAILEKGSAKLPLHPELQVCP